MKYYFIDYENVHSEGFTGIDSIAKNDVVYLMYTEHCKNISLEIIEKINKRKAMFEIIKVGTGSKNALDFQLSSFMGYIIAKNENQKCGFYIVSKDSGFDPLVEFWQKKGMNVERICNFSPNHKSAKPQDINSPFLPQAILPEQYAPSLKSEKARENNKSSELSASSVQSVLDVGIAPPFPQITSLKSELSTDVVSVDKISPPKKTSKKLDITKTTKKELLNFLSSEEYSDTILEIINSYKSKVSIKNALDKQFRDTQKSTAVYKKLKTLFKEKNKT